MMVTCFISVNCCDYLYFYRPSIAWDGKNTEQRSLSLSTLQSEEDLPVNINSNHFSKHTDTRPKIFQNQTDTSKLITPPEESKNNSKNPTSRKGNSNSPVKTNDQQVMKTSNTLDIRPASNTSRNKVRPNSGDSLRREEPRAVSAPAHLRGQHFS